MDRNSSELNIYFPRRGLLRRCLTTNPDNNCIFNNLSYPQTPSVARDLSLGYRKEAFLAEIAAKLAQLGEYEQAYIIAQILTQGEYRGLAVLALTAIAAEKIKSGEISQAQQRLSEAEEMTRATDLRNFKTRVLTQMAIQYLALEQPDVASNLLEAAIPANVESGLFSYAPLAEVAVGFLKIGQVSQAEQLIREMLNRAQSSEFGLPLSPSTLEPLLNAEKYDLVIPLVEEVEETTYRTRWLSDICFSLVGAGHYDRARQIAQMLPDPSCSNTLLERQAIAATAEHITNFINDGKIPTAISTVELISSPYDRMLLMTEAAILLSEIGDREESDRMLEQALTTSDILNNSQWVAFGSGLGRMQIAIRLSESKQFVKALEITETIEEESYQVLALLNIAEQYRQAEEIERATEILLMTIDKVASLKCTECAL